uniref:Uncharacterized protein n=1 Tax=Globisporangium ultimum (strain ATCC 200006 / CBS 805.95 / DAOM BR144) TaxID=431595 RepID=K3WTX1_GLOUD
MANGKAADVVPSMTETQESSGAAEVRVPEIAPRSEHKVVFLGDQRVGKTSIITHFAFGSFDDSEYTPWTSVGIDYLSMTVPLEDRAVNMQLWDIGGQEHIRESSNLIRMYVRNASIAIVVYDITSTMHRHRSTFLSTSKWVEAVRTERGDDVVIMLVANKSDLSDEQRQVSIDEGVNKAKEGNVLFIETSAKVKKNVQALFEKLAAVVDTAAPGLKEGTVDFCL